MDINTTHLFELFLNLSKFLLLSLGYRMTDQLKLAVTESLATDMFETQKVESFRFALPSLLSV